MLEASAFRKAAGKVDPEVSDRRSLRLKERELEISKGDENQPEKSSDPVNREKDKGENQKDQGIGKVQDQKERS